jgi:hypothetical protein
MNETVQATPWIRKVLEENLQPNEETRWLGSPSMKVLTAQDLPPVIFGLFWTILSTMITLFGSSRSDWLVSDPVLRPQGIPIILIGLALLATPLWRIRRERHTAYAITNLRAIIFQGVKRPVVSSFWPEHLKDVTHSTNTDGTGNILIGKRVSGRDEDGDRRFIYMGFFRLYNCRKPLDLIRDLAKAPDFI